MEPKFSELTGDDQDRLNAQREVVRSAALRYGLTNLPKDTSSLANLLQTIIDDNVFAPGETYELQSLGVVLGDIACDEGEFRWAIVEDEYGRDPTLRWKSSSTNVNALT